ncbi:hypothetical protein JIQ42_08266 [Leishmania sp. Namibia]|uniref:hypothetical protein n=1 Tax=Leishmania sp. Namibia TaxID=2802991 RepID=UPI001B529AC1|nr:hypothetical protein JIQ42_08266 [Leishmania sp. Namibia]
MSPIHKKQTEVISLGVEGTDSALSQKGQRLPMKSYPTSGAVPTATATVPVDSCRSTLPDEEDLSNATCVSSPAAATKSSTFFSSRPRISPTPLAYLPTCNLPADGSSVASPLTDTSVCAERYHVHGAEEPAAVDNGAVAVATRMPAQCVAPATHDAPADFVSTSISIVDPAPLSPMTVTAPTHNAGNAAIAFLRSLPRRAASVAAPSLRAFYKRLQKMSLKQFLWVVTLVTLVMVGNFMQIVMLNFWLISFPSDGAPGNYTAFAVPGIFFAILFVLLLGAYIAIRRPSLSFARHAHGWVILTGVGFCDAINSWMATYAASYTSEVLQALFSNLCPLYAVFLSKWILRDTRRYANPYVVSVFVLTICGILAASLYGIIKDHEMGEGKWWILIFFLSMPFRVLMNVWQSLYMIVYTRDPKFVSWMRVRLANVEEAGSATSSAAQDNDESTPKTSDTFVRGGADVVADPASPLDTDYAKITPSFTRYDGRGSMGGLKDNEKDLRSAGPAKDAKTKLAKSVKHGSADADGDYALVNSAEARTPVTDDGTRGAAVIVPVATPDEPVAGPVGEHHGVHSLSGAEDGEDLGPTPGAAPPLPTQTMFTVRYNQGEDTIVKLVMLAGETFIQMCFTLSLLPADALPWWGNSDTVSATWENFIDGIRCVFTIRENFLYCFLFTLGFLFTYVGCAYLNHYSAALCSIVTQLSSPVTALMLVIVPSWNVQVDGDSPWYNNLIAIFFLCVAALIYVMWEEMTDAEKVQAEYELKMRELRVRPSSHEAPHSVTIRG